jgi:hypothetical protein
MVRSAQEATNNEKLSRREPARTAGQQKKKQRRGVDEQLQRTVWDPGGFQQ